MRERAFYCATSGVFLRGIGCPDLHLGPNSDDATSGYRPSGSFPSLGNAPHPPRRLLPPRRERPRRRTARSFSTWVRGAPDDLRMEICCGPSDGSGYRLPPAAVSRLPDELKNYFYGLLLICERGTTGLGHINS